MNGSNIAVAKTNKVTYTNNWRLPLVKIYFQDLRLAFLEWVVDFTAMAITSLPLRNIPSVQM